MSDFVAQIQAVLDTSKAEAQLKDLEKNQKIKLDVDDSKIEEAQKKLKDISKDKQKIKLDVDVNKSAQKEGGISYVQPSQNIYPLREGRAHCQHIDDCGRCDRE